MYHDEPSHRSGQDPYAYAAETEEHYGATVREYQERLRRMDRSGALPCAGKVVEVYEKTVAQYQGYLDTLINQKRADGRPISFDYAQLDDVVFRDDSTPWTQDGKPYTKRDMQTLSHGNDNVAKQLIDAANARGEWVLILAAAKNMGLDRVDAGKLTTLLETGDGPDRGMFVGKIVGVDTDKGLVFQATGRGDGVVLPLDKLSRPVEVGEMATIAFKNGRGTVLDREQSRDRGR